MNLFSMLYSYRVTRNAFLSLLGFGFLLCSQSAFSTQVVATVSKSTVAVNEVFQLMVTIDKSSDRGSIDFEPLQNHFVTGNTNYGSYNSFSNGKRTVQTQWTISLAAKQVGKLTIPSFTVDGTSSQPIVLQVTKDSIPVNPSDVVEIHGSLSKHRLYIGETATYDVKLIIKADPRMLQNPVITPPSGDAFTVIANGEGTQKQGVLNGVKVLVVEQQFQIVPKSPGKQILEGTHFQSKLIQSRRTGSTRIVPINVNSGLLNIDVLDKPSGYVGLWLPTTKLTLSEQWQLNDKPFQLPINRKLSLKTGEAITRTLVLTASDLPQQQLPNIVINYPAAVSVYDEKPIYGVDDNGNTVMTIKQVLIPRTSGEISLPTIDIPWWNSAEDKAMTASLEKVTLNVVVDMNSVQTMAANNQALPTISSQVKIITDSGFWPYLTALFALLWLLTLGLWFYLNRHSKLLQPSQELLSNIIDPSSQNLINAILADDTITASRLYTQWLDGYLSQLTAESITQLSTEMDHFLATQYGKTNIEWDSVVLVSLIRDAQNKNSGQTKSHLAQLEPQ
ncbi:MAG: BatD family protein [Aliivibrio sp.]|uniref:BatD family protein n=1 Tax=Aliivibrio sp. TaxID=1872443 RepID=UPI001A3AE2A3|nr:BatD family protein [Aliivibrio sp.]